MGKWVEKRRGLRKDVNFDEKKPEVVMVVVEVVVVVVEALAAASL